MNIYMRRLYCRYFDSPLYKFTIRPHHTALNFGRFGFMVPDSYLENFIRKWQTKDILY